MPDKKHLAYWPAQPAVVEAQRTLHRSLDLSARISSSALVMNWDGVKTSEKGGNRSRTAVVTAVKAATKKTLRILWLYFGLSSRYLFGQERMCTVQLSSSSES